MAKRNSFRKRLAIYAWYFSMRTTEAYNKRHGLKPGDAGYRLAKIPKVFRWLAGE
jgi:hypothetical protein